MKRIFLTLSVLSTLLLVAALVLGLQIGDAAKIENRGAVSNHMLTALAALVFASLVHAILLTYFMGTGRWMEETTRAYKLPVEYAQESARLKYSTIPLMVVCLVLLIVTGGFGAAADPRGTMGFSGWFGLTGKQIHFFSACCMLGVNMLVNLFEYQAIDRNGRLIKRAMAEVQRIRQEHGLPV